MRLISPVLAQAAAPAGAPSIVDQLLQMLPMFVMIVVIFYFVIYRPQKQQRDKHKAMISDLKKGDKVVTTGGIWGTVTNIGKETVTLQVAENTKVKLMRDHIARLRGDEND
jgi:preprotein translocase subunit YajC